MHPPALYPSATTDDPGCMFDVIVVCPDGVPDILCESAPTHPPALFPALFDALVPV